MVNIRQKGAEAEREIYRALNPIVQHVMMEMEFPMSEVQACENLIQRNQNQSAVGGCDLTNTFGMAIEVKRQEQLSINTWWKQTTVSAETNNEHPVLLYRQSGKKWKCITNVLVQLPTGKCIYVRAEMDWDAFLGWFKAWVTDWLKDGRPYRK